MDENKLISMLQPRDYVSKIKLYCVDCVFSGIKKETVKEAHTQQIIITEKLG